MGATFELLHAAERVFEAAVTRPAGSEAPARRVFDSFRGGDLEPVHPSETGGRLPVCTHLDVAIASARAHGGPMADVADSLASLAPRLIWERRSGVENQTVEFADGHANTILVRSENSERQVVIGASLMAPHVRYPDHHHPPEEVYIVLSPGEWRQNEDSWCEPGPGNVVHNSPNIVHAMRSREAPLLALWLHLDER